MSEGQRRYRADKQPPNKKKSDRILNYLIAIVVILIIAVATYIFSGGAINDKQVKEEPKETVKEEPKEPKKDLDDTEGVDEKKKNIEGKLTDETKPKDLKDSDSAVVTKSTDSIVDEVIEDSSWKPHATKQQDDGSTHNSSYDENSVDWQEKVQAIATVTSIESNDMIVWYMKNGGSSDTSIGTVSTKDKQKMYRVTLKWVTKEGWKPMKVETLKQIEGAY